MNTYIPQNVPCQIPAYYTDEIRRRFFLILGRHFSGSGEEVDLFLLFLVTAAILGIQPDLSGSGEEVDLFLLFLVTAAILGIQPDLSGSGEEVDLFLLFLVTVAILGIQSDQI